MQLHPDCTYWFDTLHKMSFLNGQKQITQLGRNWLTNLNTDKVRALRSNHSQLVFETVFGNLLNRCSFPRSWNTSCDDVTRGSLRFPWVLPLRRRIQTDNLLTSEKQENCATVSFFLGRIHFEKFALSWNSLCGLKNAVKDILQWS